MHEQPTSRGFKGAETCYGHTAYMCSKRYPTSKPDTSPTHLVAVLEGSVYRRRETKFQMH